MIFRIPYRWLPSTFFANVYSMWHDICHGIANVIRWIPVIWFDEDYDWSPLAEIMEWKLRRMSKVLYNGHHVGSNKDAKRTLICAEILKRIREDKPIEPITRISVERDMARKKEWGELMGKIIGKHLRGWWD